MFGHLGAVCCCDGGGDGGTPVTACPDPPITPHVATVTLVVSASPKAWCVVTSYDCGPEADYDCGSNPAQIAGLEGTSGVDLHCKYCQLDVPTAQFSPGIADAKSSVCWSASTTTSGTTTFATTCNECSSEVKSMGSPHSDSWTFSMECGDEQTFGDPDVDGISGSVQVVHCCDNCTCDLTGILKCTQIIVTLNARWSQTFTGVPVLSENISCYDCDGDASPEAREIVKTGTDTVTIVHTQNATVTMERVVTDIYTSQRIAPGSYLVRYVTVSTLNGNQLTYSPNAHASNNAAGYYHMSGSDFSLCCASAPTTESDDCSSALLLSYGWALTLVVSA